MMNHVANWWRQLIGSSSATYEERLRHVRSQFAQDADFHERELLLRTEQPMRCTLFFYKSLTDDIFIQTQIIERLFMLQDQVSTSSPRVPLTNDFLLRSLLTGSTINITADWVLIEQYLKQGAVAVLLERETDVLFVQAPRTLARAIEEPANEFVARGPRDGFTEDIQVNLGLVRKRLKGAQLITKSYILGRKSRTICVLLYIADLVTEDVLTAISQKLNQIDTDALLESCQLEELIEDHSYSPFDEYMNTERADKVVADLLEGRIALLLDGSPTALVGPASFFNLLSSPDDYYQRALPSTLHRFLRLSGFLISTHLSAVYLSLVTYHAHLIPMKLVEVLMSKREQVPFPPLFEIFIIQIMIDLILEAILRLPTKLGQIIGVSAAIIIGQAAVSANLISPGVIIVVSITTISGFAMPRLSTAYTVQLMRYANLFLASMMGGYGLMVSMMFWVIHLCNMHSLGKAYLSPLSPFHWRNMRDMVIRLPKWLMSKQPDQPGTQHTNK